MADSPIPDLRSPEALRFQRRVVLIERLGWVAMAALIAAALAGLVGPGPLSTGRTSSTDGRLVVHHARFLRSGSTTEIDIQLTLDDPTSAPRVSFDADHLATFTVEGIQPEPDEVVTRGDRVEFVFAPPVDATTVAISFALRADDFGPRTGTIASGEASSVTFQQFIYP